MTERTELQAAISAKRTPNEVAETLRKLATGRVEWRVQNPETKAYCMSFSRDDSVNAQADATEWRADFAAKFPDHPHAKYEVAEVRVFSRLEKAAIAAADLVAGMQLSEAPKWQGIESAPKDGADILLGAIDPETGHLGYVERGYFELVAEDEEDGPWDMRDGEPWCSYEGRSEGLYWCYWSNHDEFDSRGIRFLDYADNLKFTHWMPLPPAPGATVLPQTDTVKMSAMAWYRIQDNGSLTIVEMTKKPEPDYMPSAKPWKPWHTPREREAFLDAWFQGEDGDDSCAPGAAGLTPVEAEMIDVTEIMCSDVLTGHDAIFTEYAKSFGLNPVDKPEDARFMAKTMQAVEVLARMWWQQHRDDIREALVDLEAKRAAPSLPPPVATTDQHAKIQAKWDKDFAKMRAERDSLKERLFKALETDGTLKTALHEVDHVSSSHWSPGIYSQVLDIAAVHVARVKELEAEIAALPPAPGAAGLTPVEAKTEPTGFRLLPVKPFIDMLQAALEANRADGPVTPKGEYAMPVGYELHCARRIWDVMIAAAPSLPLPVATTDEPFTPLSEFTEGQWWVKELDALLDGPISDDQKRAIAVVHHLLRSVKSAAAPKGELQDAPSEPFLRLPGGDVPALVFAERLACARLCDKFAHTEGIGDRRYSGNVLSARILARSSDPAACRPEVPPEHQGGVRYSLAEHVPFSGPAVQGAALTAEPRKEFDAPEWLQGLADRQGTEKDARFIRMIAGQLKAAIAGAAASPSVGVQTDADHSKILVDVWSVNNVAAWLENGCNPIHAAAEIRTWIPARGAAASSPLLDPEVHHLSWTEFDPANNSDVTRFGDQAPLTARDVRGYVPAESRETERGLLLSWAVDRWLAEVKNRPLVNIHRRSLDDAWRQVIRYAGGDPETLIGPAHDMLAAGSSKEGSSKP